MKQYGVIDLGTNTFHLLIIEQNEEGGFRELHRERRFVKLAEDGIETIGKSAFQRGVDALVHYQSTVSQFQLSGFKIFGTAALRTASNGTDFVNEVKRLTDIDIELISGDEEAQLIYKGVKQAVPFGDHNSLIMDIGGGSVEFILANESGLHWAQSFPIGVAVLYNEFHHTDPISDKEINAIYSHLEKKLSPLLQRFPQYPLFNLVGASGTFDVMEEVLAIEKISPMRSIIPADAFPAYYQQLIQTNLQERYSDDAIPDSRAELIIVAIMLINFVLEKTNIQQIDVSAYAMKEGMLADMMKKDK